MTGTNCDLFTHKSSRSYLNHLVYKNCKRNVFISVKKMVRKMQRRNEVLNSKKPFRSSASKNSDADDIDSENIDIDEHDFKKSVQKDRSILMCCSGLH